MRTMRQMNRYLAQASDNRLEIIHGNGYFYYAQTDAEFAENRWKQPPPSESVCYIRQGTTEDWERTLDAAVKAYDSQKHEPSQYREPTK